MRWRTDLGDDLTLEKVDGRFHVLEQLSKLLARMDTGEAREEYIPSMIIVVAACGLNMISE